MTLSTIVTIADFANRPWQLLERLTELASVLDSSEFELVIGHANREQPADIELKKRMADYVGVKIISVIPNGNLQELSRLRNAAVSESRSPILILLDADIYPDLALFRALTGKVSAGQRLSIAPCMYLTSAGSKCIKKPYGISHIVNSTLAYSPEFVVHWAIPSSVMALRNSDYWEVGGFFEKYVGHGYEDFDFMLRIALHADLITPTGDLLIDKTYRAPLLSIGFRAALGRLCLTNLLEKNIAFHLYHKNYNSSYRKRRLENAKIFHKRIMELVCSHEQFIYNGYTLTLINDFFVECLKQKIDPVEFYALFDARPRYMIISKSWGAWVKKIFFGLLLK